MRGYGYVCRAAHKRKNRTPPRVGVIVLGRLSGGVLSLGIQKSL